MSFKVVSSIAGSVATIGTGLGVYLSTNSKNHTNNPPQKTTDALDTKGWIDLLNKNPEYIKAKKTGKIVNFVTYKENETVDNNADYFFDGNKY